MFLNNLTKSRYYGDEFVEKEYSDAQVKRHHTKRKKERTSRHYKKCIEKRFDLIPENSKMLCLGTRNNKERDIWRSLLKERNVEVSSLDIAEESEADFIMNFQNFPEDWKGKWDVIFSNSIDHAANPESTLLKWLDLIRVGGIAILGFDVSDHCGTPTDCSVFDKDGIEEFFATVASKSCVKMCKATVDTYVYYTVKKIEIL